MFNVMDETIALDGDTRLYRNPDGLLYTGHGSSENGLSHGNRRLCHRGRGLRGYGLG